MTYTQFIEEKSSNWLFMGKTMKINIRPMTHKDKPSITKILRSTPEFKPSEVA